MGSVHKMAPVSFGDASVCILTSGLAMFAFTVRQGCQTQFLEGHSPAEFCSNPAPTHIPCSFQISLKDLISWIRCV